MDPPPHNRMRVGAGTPIIHATIDHLSAIRYVHAQSLRAAALTWADENQAQAYASFIYAPEYSSPMERAIGSHRLFAASIDGRIVGTCGWSPMEDHSPIARIRWCYVLPMFSRLGIGRRLLSATEASAEAEGYLTLVVEATPDAVGFFETAGFGVTAQGTRSLPGAESLPVTYLRRRLS
jgi:GNAT superfamily N-acetyltransferase